MHAMSPIRFTLLAIARRWTENMLAVAILRSNLETVSITAATWCMLVSKLDLPSCLLSLGTDFVLKIVHRSLEHK